MERTTPSASATERGRGSSAERLAREVSTLQAALLDRLQGELSSGDPALFASAARRLAEDFGAVTATAMGALFEARGSGAEVDGANVPGDPHADVLGRPAPGDPHAAEMQRPPSGDRNRPGDAEQPAELRPGAHTRPDAHMGDSHEGHAELHRPGAMRHRLDQLVETHARYGHPFGLAVFDAEGPGTRSGNPDGGPETVQAVLGAALRDSVRLVDETFRLAGGALCVLAPNQDTVGGVRMAERLLQVLDELEDAGGMRIGITAGVVACPEHGSAAEPLLHKADEAMWRARAVGQPVGVGAIES